MRLVLYQPDIPQNTGTLMRLAAALGVPLDLIEPCGFLLDDRRLRRAGMDYRESLDLTRHPSWTAYQNSMPPGRLILLTTHATQSYLDAPFTIGDRLLLGQESCGVPAEIHALAHLRLRIPLCPPARSLNVALAAAMVLGEALRQTRPTPPPRLPAQGSSLGG